jgi:hypothetical protein
LKPNETAIFNERCSQQINAILYYPNPKIKKVSRA